MRLEEPLPPDLAPEAAASITCFVEEADDVWTLYSLIEKGDEVSCNTTRKVKGDNPRAASEKRHMTLTVAADAVDYDGAGDELRVAGTTRTEHELVKLGSHHTLQIGLRARVSLRKAAWDASQRATLARAADAASTADLACLLLDAERCRAKLFVLTERLVKQAASVELALPKGTHGARSKRADAQKAKFLHRCRDALAAHVRWDVVRCVVVCGRGAADAAQFLRTDATPAAACSSDAANVGHLRRAAAGGRLCVAEDPVVAAGLTRDALRAVLAVPAVAKRVEATAAARYCAALEAWRSCQRKDPDRVLCASLDAVAAAAERNALAILMVVDDNLRGAAPDVERRKRFLDLVERAAAQGAEVLYFPARHVASDQLIELGGVAATLRYPCPDLQDIVDRRPDAGKGPAPAPLPPPPENDPASLDVEELRRELTKLGRSAKGNLPDLVGRLRKARADAAAKAAKPSSKPTKASAPPPPPPKASKKAPKPKANYDEDDWDDGYDDKYDGAYDY